MRISKCRMFTASFPFRFDLPIFPHVRQYFKNIMQNISNLLSLRFLNFENGGISIQVTIRVMFSNMFHDPLELTRLISYKQPSVSFRTVTSCTANLFEHCMTDFPTM